MRAPTSTYRLQLRETLPLDRARELLPYLDALGVDWLYLSPLLQARPGSAHGYDVVDPTRVASGLGGDAALVALSRAARARGMGLLVDVVTNHMAADERNPWWRDVLEHGRSSAYARFFDIDWRPPGDPVRDRLLLPVLGDRYARVLEAGELGIALAEDRLEVRYGERALPLEPASWGRVIAAAAEGGAPREASAAATLRTLASGFASLPPHDTTDPAAAAARRDLTARMKARFAAALRDIPGVRLAIEEALAGLAGRPGEPATFTALDALLSAQPYLLVHWRIAAPEINYRRFFDIADLVGVRLEEPAVFAALHERILEWLAGGLVAGLRIDHVDGLLDPAGYLDRLREAAGAEPYIVVEKILTGEETLPAEWPVAGTTGYDFLTLVSGALVLPAGLERLQRAYDAFRGGARPFATVEYEKQRQVIRLHFAAELRALALRLTRIARASRFGRDAPARQLEQAIVEVTACLPVYRTYTVGAVSRRDRAVVERAVGAARARNPAVDDVAYEVLRRVLLLDLPSDADEATRAEWIAFVLHWQQLSGPVMAKGVEDTSLYLFNTLLSLNDVGGDPGAGALAPADLHARLAARGREWPATMNAASTHDAKRSEDVRARLHALTEVPGAWAAVLERWRGWNAWARAEGRSGAAPDADEEVLLYQTLLGAWPLDDGERAGFGERVRAYLVKAAREAKRNTSWLEPDEAYERDLVAFADAVLDPSRGSAFLPDFLAVHERLAAAGAVNSLAQLALRLGAPGVTDVYQGTELWNFSLVDPDNRRPVDFGARANRLAVLDDAADALAAARDAIRHWRDGTVKLLVLRAGLRLRRERPGLFVGGDYLPLEVVAGDGGGEVEQEVEQEVLPPPDERVIAFARRSGSKWLVTAVPRGVACTLGARLRALAAGAEGERERAAAAEDRAASRTGGDAVAWQASGFAAAGPLAGLALRLPTGAPARWRDAASGREVVAATGGARGPLLPAAAVFDPLPVALLVGTGSAE